MSYCIKGLETLARKLIFHTIKEGMRADRMKLLLCGERFLSFAERTQLDWTCLILKATPYYMTVKQASEVIWIYGKALVNIRICQFIMWTKGASYNV